MKQATHDGTCQVCGRLQALPGAVLAKHGYTVEHHYFNGVCPGAAHAPLETDRTLADQVAADLLVDASDADAKLGRVNAGKLLPQFADADFSVRDRQGKWVQVQVLYADAEEYAQKQAVRALAYRFESRAKMARSIAAEITKRADTITGKQALAPRVVDTKRELVAGMNVKVYGEVRTIVAIKAMRVQGCGPHLNGQFLPHAMFERNGKSYGIPVRLIRQAAIVD